MRTIADYLGRFQQIDQIAKRAIEGQERRIPEKYSNIEATLKLLNNLILTFRKKSQNYQQELKSRAKIGDLMEQISFHKARVVQCEKLSQNIMKKINEKREKINIEEEKVKGLRKEIIELKTTNVKKILKLEQFELNEAQQNEKENCEQKKDKWKMKTQYNRQFFKAIVKDISKNTEIEELKKQKKQLTTMIYDKLDKKMHVHKFIDELFQVMKTKLCQNQKKANLNGLNGSLMFKILENDQQFSSKPLFDSKLMIYDVLKSKYKQHLKSQQNLKTSPKVTEEQFMNYTPLQILGIIQLKGGVKKLRQSILKFDKKQQQTKIKKQQNPQQISIDFSKD